MHCFLKWIIYAAIALFTLFFGFLLIVFIGNEARNIGHYNQVKVDSVAYELKCLQDSLREEVISSVEDNSERIDSMATVIHKVESISKKADAKFNRALRKIDIAIDSANCCP